MCSSVCKQCVFLWLVERVFVHEYGLCVQFHCVNLGVFFSCDQVSLHMHTLSLLFVLLQKVFERLHLMYTVGYSISLASLLVAVSILCYFK